MFAAAPIVLLLMAANGVPSNGGCGAPDRPPDPRCGEPLDARAPAQDPEPKAATAALAIPRGVSWVAFWPILKTSEELERRDVPEHLKAVTTSDDGKVGVRPELQYASGFRPTLGARFFYDRLPSGSRALLRARTGGPDILLGEVAFVGPPRWGLQLGARWDRRNDRLFAGIGPASRATLEASGGGISRYQADMARTDARWWSRWQGPLSVGLGAGLEARTYGIDDVRGTSIATLYGAPPDACAAQGREAPCVDTAQVPGFDRSRRLAVQEARVALDLRNPARDGSGLTLAADARHARGFAGDPSNHLRLGFEAVVAIGGFDRALLLRATMAVVEPLGGAPVPFDELVSPSGRTGMRGFPVGRFRDRSGMVGTVEYRWLISHRLDASLFVDSGAVAGPWFDGLRPSHFFPSVGAGLRIYQGTPEAHWEAALDYGVQIAYSRESGVRLLLAAAAF